MNLKQLVSFALFFFLLTNGNLVVQSEESTPINPPEEKTQVTELSPEIKPISPSFTPDINDLLDRKLNVPFRDGVTLQEFVAFLRDALPGINIIIDREINREETFNYNVVAVPLKFILREILLPMDWGFMVTDGVILITTKEKIIKSLIVTRWYDILDLIIPIADFPGPHIGLDEPEEEMEEEAIPRVDPEQLIDLITKQLAKKEGWDDPFSIEYQEGNGVLIVKHLPSAHKQIQRLLSQLR